ncbi:MAG: hypothetical protein JWR52_387 [Marmoricola sp.]|nr:hypothetical protein [Marmoricola sp.]
MPLSEEELRLLEQMERALAAEDPKFVSALQGRTLRRVARMRSAAAGLVFLGGIAMLMGGAVSEMLWLGVLGFLVMLSSAMIGLAAWRGHRVPDERPSSPDALFDFDDHPHRFEVLDGGRAPKPKRQRRPRRQAANKSGTFMQRIEQRWQHRRDQGF